LIEIKALVPEGRSLSRKEAEMMDTLMGSLAIYASVAIVLILLLNITVMMWRRGWRDERPLFLGLMLERQGASLPGAVTHAAGYDYARAVRRCVNCGVPDTCGKWLETGKRDGYAEFCPNAEFIERLKKAT
jgi:hypothetical protein